jgi:hypothetical protein
MALSMEEQRILAEIEQELARTEPVLAARLSAFGRPSRGAHARSSRPRERVRSQRPARRALHSPWVLVAASLIALVLLTVVPVAVYALVSLRIGPKGHSAGHPAVSAQHHGAPVHPIMSPPR